MKKAKPGRFNKLLSFVKNQKGQIEDKLIAEKQSPQASNIPDIKPIQEAAIIVSKRKALQKKQGRHLYES